MEMTRGAAQLEWANSKGNLAGWKPKRSSKGNRAPSESAQLRPLAWPCQTNQSSQRLGWPSCFASAVTPQRRCGPATSVGEKQDVAARPARCCSTALSDSNRRVLVIAYFLAHRSERRALWNLQGSAGLIPLNLDRTAIALLLYPATYNCWDPALLKPEDKQALCHTGIIRNQPDHPADPLPGALVVATHLPLDRQQHFSRLVTCVGLMPHHLCSAIWPAHRRLAGRYRTGPSLPSGQHLGASVSSVLDGASRCAR